MKLSFVFSSLVASTLAHVGHGMVECASSYSGGNYYKVLTNEQWTWEQAKADADSMSICGVQGHLVTITSSAENDIVTNAVQQCGENRVSWIGLTDHATEGTFEWVTGEALNYHNFCQGEPNNDVGGEDYVEVTIDGGCWNDINLAGYNNVDKFVVEFDNVPSDCPDLPGGGAITDPHFKTWTGQWYDFMGECDLHLVEAPFFAPGLDLVIDIRTKIRYDYSYIESAAVKIGEDILEVDSFGEYFFNGVDGGVLPDTISGLSLSRTQLDAKKHEFVIQVEGADKIVITSMKDMVSVKIEDADTDRFHGSKGMMGEFGTGNLLARDGNTVVEDPNALAAEWQVRDNEPMLFQTINGPQYPQKCIMPKPVAEKRRLGESIARSAAEKACANLSEHAFDACVHDVMATGDLEMATAGTF